MLNSPFGDDPTHGLCQDEGSAAPDGFLAAVRLECFVRSFSRFVRSGCGCVCVCVCTWHLQHQPRGVLESAEELSASSFKGNSRTSRGVSALKAGILTARLNPSTEVS